MRTAVIQNKKDKDGREREYTVTVLRPDGANEMPRAGACLEDLIAVGLIPIMRLVDTVEKMLEDGNGTEAELIIIEQIRRLLADMEGALYRFDEGTAWNIPDEWEPILEKLDVIPVDKFSEVQKAIEPFVPQKPAEKAA